MQPEQPVTIAVVEDDPEIRSLVGGYLEAEGFRVVACANGAALDAYLQAGRPDVVVLDLMMPGEDGLSICRRIAPALPVLVLSAKGEDLDRIVGLEVGADDYLAKPFNPRELLARLRAILRARAQTSAPPPAQTSPTPKPAPPRPDGGPREILVFQGWRLDVDGRALRAPSGEGVTLTSGEMTLLIVLARRAGRVLSRDQLLDATRGRDADPFDRAIDVQVSRLRRKLTAAGGANLIKTIRGDGYLFAADMERPA
ncbi:MAG: response regulator [Pseudomonadota bacterium]